MDLTTTLPHKKLKFTFFDLLTFRKNLGCYGPGTTLRLCWVGLVRLILCRACPCQAKMPFHGPAHGPRVGWKTIPSWLGLYELCGLSRICNRNSYELCVSSRICNLNSSNRRSWSHSPHPLAKWLSSRRHHCLRSTASSTSTLIQWHRVLPP